MFGPLPVQRIVAAAVGDDDAFLGAIDEGVDDETGGGVMVFVHRLPPSCYAGFRRKKWGP